jgi:hypothetical protein
MTTSNSYQYSITSTSNATYPNCTIITNEIAYSTFSGNATFDINPNETLILVLTRQSYKHSVISINRNGNYSLWSANKLVDPNVTIADNISTSYTKSVLADGAEWWFVIINQTPGKLVNQSLNIVSMTTAAFSLATPQSFLVQPGVKQSFKLLITTKQVFYIFSFSGDAKLDLVSDVVSFGTVSPNSWIYVDSGNYLFGQFTVNTTITNVTLTITTYSKFCI